MTTGWFGTHTSLVPITEASEEGATVRVPYAGEQVRQAPHHRPGQELSEEEEADLFRHYGVRHEGRDISGPTTDDAMTLSEERLRVGTERVQTGRVRLRKYIVTENVQTTVPVSHEEIRIERERITEANREAALSGPELSEEEHELTLTAERPVVGKETVPVERVRLGKETTTEQRQVADQVRREEIEVEDQSGGAPETR